MWFRDSLSLVLRYFFLGFGGLVFLLGFVVWWGFLFVFLLWFMSCLALAMCEMYM